MKKHLALLVVLSLLVIVATATTALAATGSTPADTVASGLVLAWGVLAPLTVYRWLPLSDTAMKATTMVAAVVIAVIALAYTGQLQLSSLDPSQLATVIAAASLVYGETQFVWTLLKDHPATAKLVS